MMFHTILVANRGEIACRVIATARAMGIRTVAVYSDVDAGALHVTMADLSVRIGPAPVAESYLRGDAIIAAALATGAQAIHPGYGFLSENPDFVAAVAAAGLVFVGPSESAIRAMGLKDAAKALMEKAGVPVVPGYHGAGQGDDLLAQKAEQTGYPVLIKARAGGGGKGMRLVEKPGDFKASLDSARREAQASFGDPAVLIERYVTTPRHVEIQIFADSHGNVVHLFERDCSLQRRHQKVIEEAPAPGMPEDVRAAMGAAAVEAARAAGYVGAGTVEFIADGSRGLQADGFWFMEMNTRLQVEHPVSEAITGLDFVELQLRIAAGEPLPFAQGDLRIDGHAIEARVYAEDVPKGFLPATGTLHHLAFPPVSAFQRGPVRIDSGVRQGDVISPWYDPMIAKVIVHAPTRTEALNRLAQALGGCHVAGAVTNLEFLGALARDSDFAAGRVDTGLIARNLETLTAGVEPTGPETVIAALAALGLLTTRTGGDPWDLLTGWRQWGEARQSVVLIRGDERIEVTVAIAGQGRFTSDINGETCDLHVVTGDGTRVVMTCGGMTRTLDVVRMGERVTVFTGARSHVFMVPDDLEHSAGPESGGDQISAPMPGLVKLIMAEPGQMVRRGDPLLVLEAMKMEHTLTAPRDGKVEAVLARPGDQVDDGTMLLALVPEDG